MNNPLQTQHPFHPDTVKMYGLYINTTKRPTFDVACQSLIDISIATQHEDLESIEDFVFDYLINSNLMPINDLDIFTDLITRYFDRIITFERSGEFLKQASEYFGAEVTKTEYNAWEERQDKMSNDEFNFYAL